MSRFNFGYQAFAAIGLSLGFMIFPGCGGGDQPATSATAGGHEEHEGHDHGDHAHPSEGPHHGELVELGNEEYHAEMVHDEAAGSVTIYLLDSAAKSSVPIEAAELLVNLSHDGKAEQFTLAASPDAGDPSGKSSRFVSTDKELAEDLDREGASAQLVATIGGKQFRGELGHDHDGHDDHDHDDHDHDDKDHDDDHDHDEGEDHDDK